MLDRLSPKLSNTLEKQWCEALRGGDIVRLAQLAHHDFILIGTGTGGAFAMDRDAWLAAVQCRDILDVVEDVQSELLFPNLVVATVHACWRLMSEGRLFEECV